MAAGGSTGWAQVGVLAKLRTAWPGLTNSTRGADSCAGRQADEATKVIQRGGADREPAARREAGSWRGGWEN